MVNTLICNQTNFHLLPNQLENGKFNLIPVHLKRFRNLTTEKMLHILPPNFLNHIALRKMLSHTAYGAKIVRLSDTKLHNTYDSYLVICVNRINQVHRFSVVLLYLFLSDDISQKLMHLKCDEI